LDEFKFCNYREARCWLTAYVKAVDANMIHNIGDSDKIRFKSAREHAENAKDASMIKILDAINDVVLKFAIE
jgi:hypothetical protein